MAKISTYPGPSSPSLSDMLIGTDVNDMNMTKNFSILDILSVSGSTAYVPYIGATNNVDLGSYTLTTDILYATTSVDANTITFSGSSFVIADTGFTNIGLNIDLASNKYYLGDTIGSLNSTTIVVDDSNSRIELNGSIYTNGSVGTAGRILTSQGAGLPATWALPSFVPYTGATGDVNLGIYKLTANRLIANIELTTPVVKTNSSSFFISDSSGTYSGLWLNFSGKKYYLGDVSTQLNGTMLTVDDLNNRIEINSQFYTNGSVGTSGQVLISQGAGLPPTWTSALAPFYGSFYDVNSQTTLGTTEELMQFGTTDISVGVTIVNNGLGDPTRITVASTGVYNIQFSAQLTKTGGSTGDVYIYLKKNGIIVPNSNTQLTLANNGHYVVASWNFFVQLNAGQYAEIAWYSTNANVELHYNAIPVVGLPAIPSIILTVNRVS
jgi:hypothetical protein